MSVFRIGIIGMGPRGLSVLERLCANVELVPNQAVEIHVVDPYPAGAGKVWRTDQSQSLLMNTVASQITIFADDSVECKGPKVEGPSLYEWARFLTLFDIDRDYSDEVLAEARNLEPDSYPTRAFYGYYLQWVYHRLLQNLPPHLDVISHRSTALALDDAPNGQQVIRLEKTSTPLVVDTVVLALGHSEMKRSKETCKLNEFSKNNGLFYVPPSNPADVILDRIKPGEPVILRGLGLNFFDYMALLTVGRGGQFEREKGKLVYKASGQEPRMYAGSRRGVPYHARGENEKGVHGRHKPLFLTNDIIRQFRERVLKGERVQFREEVWPLIAKEVETVYYTTLIRSTQCSCRAERFQNGYAQCSWRSDRERQLLEEYGVGATDRWSWELLDRPYDGIPLDKHHQFQAWLLEYLRKDLVEAKRGNISGPLKAALDVLRDLRNEVRLVVDHGGISGDSYRDDLNRWYTPFNAFLSIGPPASRIEEVIALMEAGILEVIGPRIRVEAYAGPACFRAFSEVVSDRVFEAKALIEARLPGQNLNKTTNPLLSYLRDIGQCQSYHIPNEDGSSYNTGGLTVTPPPNRLVNQNGVVHPRRFAYGVPTEGVHWVTFAGIRPGVNSVILADSDAIARATLMIGKDQKRLGTPIGGDL